MSVQCKTKAAKTDLKLKLQINKSGKYFRVRCARVVGGTSSEGFCPFGMSSGMRLVEAESSSTLELAEDGDLTIHCSGESRTQPVWYHNGEQLVENAQTVINVRVDATNNVRESILTRSSDVSSLLGEYQCRDTTGYQASSVVLTVTRAGN